METQGHYQAGHSYPASMVHSNNLNFPSVPYDSLFSHQYAPAPYQTTLAPVIGLQSLHGVPTIQAQPQQRSLFGQLIYDAEHGGYPEVEAMYDFMGEGGDPDRLWEEGMQRSEGSSSDLSDQQKLRLYRQKFGFLFKKATSCYVSCREDQEEERQMIGAPFESSPRMQMDPSQSRHNNTPRTVGRPRLSDSDREIRRSQWYRNGSIRYRQNLREIADALDCTTSELKAARSYAFKCLKNGMSDEQFQAEENEKKAIKSRRQKQRKVEAAASRSFTAGQSSNSEEHSRRLRFSTSDEEERDDSNDDSERLNFNQFKTNKLNRDRSEQRSLHTPRELQLFPTTSSDQTHYEGQSSSSPHRMEYDFFPTIQ